MNAIDIIILCLFLPAIYIGIAKGFIRQLAALVAIFLGAYIAYRFSGMLLGFVPAEWGVDPDVMNIILFILTFLLTALAVNLTGRLVKKIIHITMLGWLDRLLGIAFAALKTAILISVAILLLETLNRLWTFLPTDSIAGSQLYDVFKDIAPTVFPYIRSCFA